MKLFSKIKNSPSKLEFIAGKKMNQPSNQVIQIGRNQICSDQKASISQVD